MTTFSNRSNARRAARKALGVDAVEGRDFTVTEESEGRWVFAKAAPKSAPKGKSPAAKGIAAAKADDAKRAKAEKAKAEAAPAPKPAKAKAKDEREVAENGEVLPKVGTVMRHVLNMLCLPSGTTAEAILDFTGWKACYGTIGTMDRRYGLGVKKSKGADGKTRYTAANVPPTIANANEGK